MPTIEEYLALIASGVSPQEASQRFVRATRRAACPGLAEVIERAFPEAVAEVEARTGLPWWAAP